MRYTPMTMYEQCTLETEMIEHFKLIDSDQSAPSSKLQSKHVRRLPAKAVKALSISQAFLSLANDEVDAPLDVEEMILAIRYKMGYGWVAWFLFKNFAVPIIKWLWNRFHNK